MAELPNKFNVDPTTTSNGETQINPEEFKQAVSAFATGICIVTTRSEDSKPIGITISSFSSVSLDPPLVLFCLRRLAKSHATIVKSETFCINVLTTEQLKLADRCTVTGGGALLPDEIANASDDAIYIKGCLASLVCSQYEVLPSGDHSIILGHVKSFNPRQIGSPLIRFGRKYTRLAS